MFIGIKFPESTIVNPNSAEHQEAYQRWKREKGSGMKYYFEEVLPTCDAGIFVPFSDGKWGAGVWGEALWLAERKKPISKLTQRFELSDLIISVEEPNALSIKQTRDRVYAKTPFI